MMYELRTEDFHGTELVSAYTKDGHYIGNESLAKSLTERGIQPELAKSNHSVCSIGFCDKEQKWYGWSHRAMYGFTIGSTVKEGDCAYNASDKGAFIKQCLDFWKNDNFQKNTEAMESEDSTGVNVSWTYNDQVPNERIRGTKCTHFTPYPDEMGRGEWTALTLDEAKQMAIDFAESVS